MANRTRRQRRRRRGGKRNKSMTIPGSRISAPRNRLMRNPPSLNLQSNLCSLWIRGEWGQSSANQALSIDFSLQNALDEMGLLKVFNEIKIKRVNMWFLSKLAITEPGLTAMCIFDDKQENLKTIDFASVAASPGSDSRRVYQTLCCAWYPTEPSDRDWQPVGSTPFLHIYIATSRNPQAANTINGGLIVDSHVSLRGLNTAATISLLRQGETLRLMSPPLSIDFEELTV